jgi:hypothetical protein
VQSSKSTTVGVTTAEVSSRSAASDSAAKLHVLRCKAAAHLGQLYLTLLCCRAATDDRKMLGLVGFCRE